MGEAEWELAAERRQRGMRKQCEQRDKDSTLVALHFWTLKIKSGSVDGDVKVQEVKLMEAASSQIIKNLLIYP